MAPFPLRVFRSKILARMCFSGAEAIVNYSLLLVIVLL